LRQAGSFEHSRQVYQRGDATLIENSACQSIIHPLTGISLLKSGEQKKETAWQITV